MAEKKTRAAMRPAAREKLITYLLVLVLFTAFGILTGTGVLGSLFAGLLIPMCYYIVAAVSLNLTVGILGELSLGHAGFMCVGAYAGAIFSLLTKDTLTSVVIRLPLAFLIGGVVAAVFGVIIGVPILRLKGDYLAIVTLAFGEIVRMVLSNCYLSRDVNGMHFSFTRSIDPLTIDPATREDILLGPQAVTGVPKDVNLVIAVALVLITLFVIMNLKDSRTGRAIMAIRDNRIAAETTGISITRHKLIVFIVSAFFAGLAGVLYAHCSTFTAAKFDYNMSILILVFVVLGGIGNLRGSVLAAMILYALPELLRGFQTYRMLIYAIILIFMMLFRNAPAFDPLRRKLAGIRLFGRKEKKEEA